MNDMEPTIEISLKTCYDKCKDWIKFCDDLNVNVTASWSSWLIENNQEDNSMIKLTLEQAKTHGII